MNMYEVARPLRSAAIGVVIAAALAGCGSGATDSGVFTRANRQDAQAAMNALQNSNIPFTLITVTRASLSAPATCEVHLESRNPTTFKVYLFWFPYIGPASYAWLSMTIDKDSSRDKFHLGTTLSALPGGSLSPNGRAVLPWTKDFDVPLAQYGPEQAEKGKQVLMAHAGNVFSKPTAKCQVLTNGYLRLAPSP